MAGAELLIPIRASSVLTSSCEIDTVLFRPSFRMVFAHRTGFPTRAEVQMFWKRYTLKSRLSPQFSAGFCGKLSSHQKKKPLGQKICHFFLRFSHLKVEQGHKGSCYPGR